MGKIEDPQNPKRKGKTRGDQKEQSAPGDSTHKLIEKDIKRHTQHQKESGIVEKWNIGTMGLSNIHFSIIPTLHYSCFCLIALITASVSAVLAFSTAALSK